MKKKLKSIFEKYNQVFLEELYDNNREFAYLVQRYNELSNKIDELSSFGEEELLRERLKKHRLQIKDEAYSILQDYKKESI